MVVSSKMEQTSPNGVFQQISALYFILEVVVLAKTGSTCQNNFLHHFLLSVVKEAESQICQLPKSLLSVANEHLLRFPKPLKALFSAKDYLAFKSGFYTLLLPFWYFFNLHNIWNINNIMGYLRILKANSCLFQGFQCKVCSRV